MLVSQLEQVSLGTPRDIIAVEQTPVQI